MSRDQNDPPDAAKTEVPPKAGKPAVDPKELKKRRRLPAEEVFRIEEDEENEKLPFPDPLNG